jgi:thioredoxin 2
MRARRLDEVRYSSVRDLEGAVIVTCASCGRKNRLAAADLGRTVRCGECKTSLTPISRPIDADAEVFDDVAAHAGIPVLVDFWAAWCGPCRRAAPEVQRVAEEMAGRALVLKVDTERHPELAARFRVESIPNFVVMKGGRVVMQQPGLVPASQMVKWLETAADAA